MSEEMNERIRDDVPETSGENGEEMIHLEEGEEQPDAQVEFSEKNPWLHSVGKESVKSPIFGISVTKTE